MLDGGMGVADGAPLDSMPIDTGVPEDGGSRSDALVGDVGFDDGAIVDRGDTGRDAGGVDLGFPDSGVVDVGFPDSGVVDIGFPDSGVVIDASVPSPCDQTYRSVSVFENLRTVAPSGTEDIRSVWISQNGQTVYAGLDLPATGGGRAFDLYAFTRPAATGPFGTPTPTNFDIGLPGENRSTEVDLTHEVGSGFFWITFESNGYTEVYSATLRSNTVAHDFTDFLPQVQGFDPAERNADYRGPALTDDGLVLVTSVLDRVRMTWSLQERTRPNRMTTWSAATTLAVLNSPSSEVDSWIDGAGTTLLYASDRRGGFDIYCSTRAGRSNPWSAPRLYGGPVISNLSFDERTPFPFGTRLLLTRREGGREDVFVATP